jgi:hypothetical protein
LQAYKTTGKSIKLQFGAKNTDPIYIITVPEEYEDQKHGRHAGGTDAGPHVRIRPCNTDSPTHNDRNA